MRFEQPPELEADSRHSSEIFEPKEETKPKRIRRKKEISQIPITNPEKEPIAPVIEQVETPKKIRKPRTPRAKKVIEQAVAPAAETLMHEALTQEPEPTIEQTPWVNDTFVEASTSEVPPFEVDIPTVDQIRAFVAESNNGPQLEDLILTLATSIETINQHTASLKEKNQPQYEAEIARLETLSTNYTQVKEEVIARYKEIQNVELEETITEQVFVSDVEHVETPLKAQKIGLGKILKGLFTGFARKAPAPKPPQDPTQNPESLDKAA